MKKNNLLLAGIILLFSSGAFAQETKQADLKKSTVVWSAGKVVSGSHVGYVLIKSGEFHVKDGLIHSGEFIIDMNSIANTDLKDETYNQKLVGHLKSDDFFSVASHPTAKLTITGSEKTDEGLLVKGDLTIKGITEPVEFVAIEKDGVYNAKIVIDRTLYDVRYGSAKFYDNLKDNAIKDEFTLDVKLVLL